MNDLLERAKARIPQPVAVAWQGPATGPVLRTIIGAVAILLIVPAVYAHNPPLGIYVNGVIVGCLYALLAMGLILIYRANRIINFAQAGMGTLPALLALILLSVKHWPYPVTVLIVLIGAPLLGGLTELGTIRLFDRAPRLFVTMATIGIAQSAAFFELLLPILLAREQQPKQTQLGATAPLGLQKQIVTPFSKGSAEVGGVFFNGDHLVALIVVLAVCVGLAAFFRYTNIGIAVRAAAENGDRAKLLGIPVKRLSTIVWMIAGLLSGVSIFLRAPIVGMPIGGGLLGPGILLYALAAAVIARMESLPRAVVAGIAIGVIDQTAFFGTRNATISNALMLPVILAALLLQRRAMSRAADTGVSTWQAVKEFRPIPVQLRNLPEVVRARLIVAGVALGFFLTLPFMVGSLRYHTAALLLIYAIVGVSLVILTGWAGQISLGQWALSGIGAAVAGGLAANHGADFVVTMLAAGLAGAAFSVAIGVPAIRVPGLFLAVTTVAFASNMQFFFLNREYFGWLLPKSTSPVYRPILYGRIDASGDLAFYYVCLVFLALAMLSARSLRNSRSGRVLIAARDNPRAAQSYGVNLIRTRLVAFALAGFFAAIAGALYSYLQGAVDAPAFTPTASADLFTMTIIGGLTSVPGALVGATFLITVRNFLPNWHDLHLFAQGAGTILVLRFASGGLVEVGHRVRDRFLLRIADKHGIVVASLAGPAALPKPGANGGPSGKDAVETVPMPVVTAKAGNAAGARKTSRD